MYSPMHAGYGPGPAHGGSPLAPYQAAMFHTMMHGSPAPQSTHATPMHGQFPSATPVRTEARVGISPARGYSVGKGPAPNAWRTPKAPPASAHKPQPTTETRAAGSATKAAAPQQQQPVLHGRMVEDLRAASHGDLVQLLVDLSSFSSEAASFIECKAQALRYETAVTQATNSFGSVAQYLSMNDVETPVKQGIQKATPPPSASPSAAKVADGQTPFEKIEQEQCQPPETRSFCEERHPCAFRFGGCRNAQSCVFARAPCNLCAAWVRGDCPSGSRCSLVHRMPADASPQLKHLYEVKLARQREAAAAAPGGAGPMRTMSARK